MVVKSNPPKITSLFQISTDLPILSLPYPWEMPYRFSSGMTNYLTELHRSAQCCHLNYSSVSWTDRMEWERTHNWLVSRRWQQTISSSLESHHFTSRLTKYDPTNETTDLSNKNKSRIIRHGSVSMIWKRCQITTTHDHSMWHSLPALTTTVWSATRLAAPMLRILRRLVRDRLAVIVSRMVRRLASGILRGRHLLWRLVCRCGLVTGSGILLVIGALCTGVCDTRVVWTRRTASIPVVNRRHRRRRIWPTCRRVRLSGRLVGRSLLICLSVALAGRRWTTVLVALVCLGIARCTVLGCGWSVSWCGRCWSRRSLSMLRAVPSWRHLRQTLECRSCGILWSATASLWSPTPGLL